MDQQLTAGVMWGVAGACFIPLIFWNLLQWLSSEEDPDEELHRLVREERRRALPPHPTPLRSSGHGHLSKVERRKVGLQH